MERAGGRPQVEPAGGDVARQLVTPLRRQAELFHELVDAERRVQRELVGRLLAPLDAVFDLLEASGASLRNQAEAIEHAAQALEQTAGLMRTQAELFERTIRTLREPSRARERCQAVAPRRRGAASAGRR